MHVCYISYVSQGSCCTHHVEVLGGIPHPTMANDMRNGRPCLRDKRPMPETIPLLSHYRLKSLSKLGKQRARNVHEANFKASEEVNASGRPENKFWDNIWKKGIQTFSRATKFWTLLVAIASCSQTFM